MQTTHHSPTVLAYARSLLELASEQKQAEAVGEELGQLREIVEQNPVFGEYLADPGMGHEEQSETLKKVFFGKVSPLMWSFLGVLNLKNRLKYLPEIALAYDDLLDEQVGKIEVDVTVATKLSAEQLKEVAQQVSAALKKDAVVHQYVDESIIGGMVIRVADRLIDASVKTQLGEIRKKLLASRPK